MAQGVGMGREGKVAMVRLWGCLTRNTHPDLIPESTFFSPGWFSYLTFSSLFIIFFCLKIFFSRATPVAYGGSQAGG